jgi:C4-dicarboxylate transporter, DctM subunit
MSGTEIGLIGIALLMALFFLGAHIGFAMIVVGFIGFTWIGGLNGAIGNLSTIPWDNMASERFAVIPLYLLMGEIVGQSGMGKEAYLAARAWLGQFRGGLAMATIGACGMFAAVSGSSLAGTVVMSRVAYPEMKRLGYSERLASGVTACGGTLGILIPPSMGFVTIGILADLSIGKLFMAGIIPGISVVVFYIATIAIMCKLNPSLAPKSAGTNMREKFGAVRLTWPIAVLFVLMLWGLYTGKFTATEAASVGAFGALIIAIARKQMTGATIWSSLMETSKMAAMMIIMVVGAFMFNAFMAITRIPFTLGEAMTALGISRYILLAAVIIFYLIMGMFFDVYAVLILTIPIFYPAMAALDFDMIWYSVLMVRVIEVGFISPPFGINLFGMAGIINVPLGTIYRGVIPFVISDCVNIVFLAMFPIISTWLPSMM